MQEYLNLVDWKGLELPSTKKRCKATVKKFERSPTVLAEWIELKETLEIVQHLFTNIVKPARSKRDSRQAKTPVDNLLFELVDNKLSVWNTDSFLDRAQELVKKAIDEHAKYTTTELDRSRPVKKGAMTIRRLGEQVAVNMHTMGTSFVRKVRDVQQIAEAQIGEGVADMVEFEAQVSGHEATEKANRIQAWQGLLDWQLANRFDRDRPVLLLPGSWWSGQHEREFESAGWWQKPTRRAWCKQCARCRIVQEFGKDLHKMQ